MMENIIDTHLPDLVNRYLRVYDADSVECLHAFWLDRITGECWRYLTDENGLFYLIDGAPASEMVMLKTLITITKVNRSGA